MRLHDSWNSKSSKSWMQTQVEETLIKVSPVPEEKTSFNIKEKVDFLKRLLWNSWRRRATTWSDFISSRTSYIDSFLVSPAWFRLSLFRWRRWLNWTTRHVVKKETITRREPLTTRTSSALTLCVKNKRQGVLDSLYFTRRLKSQRILRKKCLEEKVESLKCRWLMTQSWFIDIWSAIQSKQSRVNWEAKQKACASSCLDSNLSKK